MLARNEDFGPDESVGSAAVPVSRGSEPDLTIGLNVRAPSWTAALCCTPSSVFHAVLARRPRLLITFSILQLLSLFTLHITQPLTCD